MKVFLCFAFLSWSIGGYGQGRFADTLPQISRFDNRVFILKPSSDGGGFYRIEKGSTDTFQIDLKKVVASTGNPVEHIHFQFLDKNLGFIYGNEVGYGIWPFLAKTTDGGTSWQKVLFEEKEYGPQLLQQNFYMFNQKRGILIYGSTIMDKLLQKKQRVFQYYLTQDGGSTWKLHGKKLKIINRHARLENSENFQHCEFDSTGVVKVFVLRAPWNTLSGKRSIEDRKEYLLFSDDFGKHFNEERVAK
jgi:hypothetical protein